MSDSFSGPAVARQLDNCTFCPKMCRHACPVSTTSGKESWIPQVKMDRLNRLRLNLVPWNQATTEELWACTGCRHCTVYCDHDNEPAAVLFAGRAEAARQGITHPTLQNYPERFAKREARLATSAQANFPDHLATPRATRPATADGIAFFPGCDALDKGADDVAAALAVFKQLGLGTVPLVAAPHNCGGYPLLAAGQRDAFRTHAAAVATALRGFTTVVTNCSACRYAMDTLYKAEGIEQMPAVISLAELLAKNAARLPKPTTKKPVYYHDPCHLARSSGVTEEPRAVLRTLATLREFSWNRADTECCGGGGLLPKTDPTTADAMAKRRLAEIHSQGGGIVVTSCGTCAFMLKSNAPASVEVLDLPAAVAMLSGVQYDSVGTTSADDDD